MQLAKASKDLLILAPYISLIPRFSVTVPLYEPAKSISDNFPVSVSTFIDFILDFLAILIWKTAWLREEVKFALVASVVLLLFPASNNPMTCSVLSALHSVTPAIVMPQLFHPYLSQNHPSARGTPKSAPKDLVSSRCRSPRS